MHFEYLYNNVSIYAFLKLPYYCIYMTEYTHWSEPSKHFYNNSITVLVSLPHYSHCSMSSITLITPLHPLLHVIHYSHYSFTSITPLLPLPHFFLLNRVIYCGPIRSEPVPYDAYKTVLDWIHRAYVDNWPVLHYSHYSHYTITTLYFHWKPIAFLLYIAVAQIYVLHCPPVLWK